ncbi:autotransporter assembly complex family protein [Breoghania sp. L-A4]|uniref:autotransporter assembly complex protein TamA n=1 Tax=Breoghania sp. L-A4 TaxID=2304600 RepID=UPI000E357F54|nr:autotransporter assembly complex family protein [Breoghania sp. L-A4]AXS41624.1 outer membrane protein assembly factor [Breoghania sp. L-A4]
MSNRTPLAATRAALIAGFLCAGCLVTSSAQAFELFGFTFFEDEETATPAAVPDPLPYTATITVSGGDEDLRDALTKASQLIGQADTPPSGAPGLISRALGDQQQLLARLYVSGLYGGTIEIDIAGVPLQTAVESGTIDRRAGQRVPVSIRVDTGPQFHFGDIAISTLHREGGTAADVPPGDYGLVPGEPALSDNILAAERKLVANLKAQGHPFARISDRSVVADHASRRLDVALEVDPGPTATFGAVSVSGQERTDTDFIVSQANIAPGSRYDPEALREAGKRLRALGIFGSIRVAEAEQLDADGQLPITIEVSERKRHVIGGGATISSTEGAGLEAYWRNRNLFGRGEQLSIEGSAGRIGTRSLSELEYATRIVFTKPGAFGPTTSFTATVGAKRENPEAYDSRSVYGSMRVGKQHSDTLEYAVGTEFSFAREDDALGSGNYALFGVFGEVTHDSRDDVLDPSEGFRATAFAEPAYDIETGGAMLFTKASISAYQAFDDAKRFILAGRLATGSIFGSSLKDIPPSRRYYAGGGGSVRGYAYRNIGPRVAGEVVGGRSFFEGSAEVRTRITESIGVVGFMDAGAAYSTELPDFSEPLKIGVGLGLRYYSSLGPLRFDFAVPLNPGKDDPDYAIYVGLSQAF